MALVHQLGGPSAATSSTGSVRRQAERCRASAWVNAARRATSGDVRCAMAAVDVVRRSVPNIGNAFSYRCSGRDGMGHNKLPDVRQRHEAAVAELTADTVRQLGLVYTPLALADIPALANEIAELRRLYLTARGHLRDILGDEAIQQLRLGNTSPAGLPPAE